MGFIIGLLTLFMVVDCAFLIFLVLIQLPKKEAGAGLAFGGTATDALFGAGSGTVLTKITKYAAVTFFVLAVFLAILQKQHQGGGSSFEKKLAQPGQQGFPGPGAAPASTPPATPTPAAPTKPAAEATNLPAPATPAPVTPAPTTAPATAPATTPTPAPAAPAK
jgi:preprotein translocase subunit SecG